MTSRTINTTVCFMEPFSLPGIDSPFPAGTYHVDHDEEQLETASRLFWHRVQSFLHVPRMGDVSQMRQMLPIKPQDLEEAMDREQAKASSS